MMIRQTNRHFKFDWILILIYLSLVVFGWFNIFSASSTGEATNYFDISQPYGKQLLFIGLSVILIVIVLSLEAKFYERFSSVIFLLSLASLAGLFVFGKTVSGATSWYAIGSMTIQPSEFAKAATALAVAKYVSDLQTDIRAIQDQLKTFLIIAIPAFLILLQNDTGSTVVYAAFFFALYREGLPQTYLYAGFLLLVAAVLSLKFGAILASILLVSLIVFVVLRFFKKERFKFLYIVLFSIVMVGFSITINYIYNQKLPPHQKDRISLWLRLEKDPNEIARMQKTYAYNLLESEKAISSGGLTGKGFLQGTRTTGKFVPEQHTDYIFSTVGEEWGFLGTSLVIVLFIVLLLRIVHLSELQKNQFSRVYGYCVASIIFIHFLINIGMVMGLIPTIGIPLPFFSYGGSGLWGFTILLFIFIKLDSNRINEW